MRPDVLTENGVPGAGCILGGIFLIKLDSLVIGLEVDVWVGRKGDCT